MRLRAVFLSAGLLLALSASCKDDKGSQTPVATRDASVDGGSPRPETMPDASASPIDAQADTTIAQPPLERPTDLPRPPAGRLSAELKPPQR